MRLAFAIAIAIALSSWSTAADAAGMITGTVWMERASLALHQRGGPVPDAAHQRGVTDGVVWIERVPAEVEQRLTHTGRWFWQHPRPVHNPRVVQSARGFSPRVASVAAGTRVEFENLDRVYHNVFSVSAARRFDLGKCAPGHVDSVAFAHTGVVNLHCDIHPDELGYVVITPNHVFTRPDSSGHFRLPKLPTGTYTVHLYLPRRGESHHEVVVPRRGDVGVDLVP